VTSHYLGCVVKGSFDSIFDCLSCGFGNIYARKLGRAGESLVGVILGEQFFFRVESDAAILIVLKELSVDETKAEIISCAAGHGLLSISYGAHTDYVHDVRNLLIRSGFRIEQESEIEYFDREKCRQFLGE
jgi:hypothetical protein